MSSKRTSRSNKRAQSPFEAVRAALAAAEEWRALSDELSVEGGAGRAVHLAVFVEPFLEYLLCGRKTVESRFSAVKCPPYGRVAQGDLVLVKRSGGPVIGAFEVGAAWTYQLDPATWGQIRRQFTEALCAQDPDFWRSRAEASYATLMQVRRSIRLPAILWPKRDRRGWVVLRPRGGTTEELRFGEAK